MYSENCTRSPGSPERTKSLCESTGTIFSSSSLMAIIWFTALVSLHTITKSRPRKPMKKSIVPASRAAQGPHSGGGGAADAR